MASPTGRPPGGAPHGSSFSLPSSALPLHPASPASPSSSSLLPAGPDPTGLPGPRSLRRPPQVTGRPASFPVPHPAAGAAPHHSSALPPLHHSASPTVMSLSPLSPLGGGTLPQNPRGGAGTDPGDPQQQGQRGVSRHGAPRRDGVTLEVIQPRGRGPRPGHRRGPSSG